MFMKIVRNFRKINFFLNFYYLFKYNYLFKKFFVNCIYTINYFTIFINLTKSFFNKQKNNNLYY